MGTSKFGLIVLGAAVVLSGCADRTGLSMFGGGPSEPAATERQMPVGKAVFVVGTIVGPPDDKGAVLGTQIAGRGRMTGFPIVERGQSGANYVVNGFLSPTDGASGTNIIHVWDVIDASGKRLHRISGQQAAGKPTGKNKDPWQAVSPGVLLLIAQDVVSQLTSWAENRG